MKLENVSPAAEKKILAFLESGCVSWKSGNCAYQLFNRETGTTEGYVDGGGCHYYVENARHEGIVVNAMRPSLGETYRDLLLWIARESPYAYAVLNRDNEEEILNKGMVIDLALCGRGGALWLCKATRACVELKYVGDRFNVLLAEGVPPMWALAGAGIFDSRGTPVRYCQHGGLFCYGSPEALYKYVKELGPKNTTSIVAFKNRNDIGEIWCTLNGKTERKPDGWGGYIEVAVTSGIGAYAELLKKIAKEGKL